MRILLKYFWMRINVLWMLYYRWICTYMWWKKLKFNWRNQDASTVRIFVFFFKYLYFQSACNLISSIEEMILMGSFCVGQFLIFFQTPWINKLFIDWHEKIRKKCSNVLSYRNPLWGHSDRIQSELSPSLLLGFSWFPIHQIIIFFLDGTTILC